MKKRLQMTALCFFVFVPVAVCAFLLVKTGLLSFEKETTDPTTVSVTSITTQQTTQTTTQVQTTVPVTEEPVIDFENISVIDILPLSLASGSWDVKHCQGIAIDKRNQIIYYSYTNTFVKCDFEGNVLGTIKGIKGHLGDICYNEADGKVYGSFNPPGKKALYVAIIDVDGLDEIDLSAAKCGLIRTVHLREVYNDFSATVSLENGDFKRRYGVAGTDGICFGPSFETGEGNYLTIACGITPQPSRPDNDYQVILQYDVSTWWKIYSQPLSYKEYHQSGPYDYEGKYFLYTGNTNYGVQTMTYFDELNVWLLNAYVTGKQEFNKYSMFVIDGDIKPYKTELLGQPQKDEQYVLTLYCDGDYDAKHNIYGWYAENGDLGMEYMGNGLFYIIHPYETWYETQTAVAYLYAWDPSKDFPFTLAAGIGNDYTISKKKTSTN